MTIYMSNLLFNHYKNSYIQAHEQVFHSNYISSSHTVMFKSLLKETYQIMKMKIDFLLIAHYLNFFSDVTILVLSDSVF